MDGSWGDSMGVAGAAAGRGAGGDGDEKGKGPHEKPGQAHKVSVVEEWRALATVLKGMGHSEKVCALRVCVGYADQIHGQLIAAMSRALSSILLDAKTTWAAAA
eukprot:scaffold186183_cov19-Tisochrysis_lutea.AAC.1